jgi:hypothetical protein
VVFHSGLTIWKYECKASTILEVLLSEESKRESKPGRNKKGRKVSFDIFSIFDSDRSIAANRSKLDRSSIIIVSSLHEHPHTTRIVNSRVKGWWGGWTTTTHIFFQTGPN